LPLSILTIEAETAARYLGRNFLSIRFHYAPSASGVRPSQKNWSGAGIGSCGCADDRNIFVRSAPAGERVMASIL